MSAQQTLFANMSDLNRNCYCFAMERAKIDDMIISLSQSEDEMKALLADRAHYFASTGVFLSPKNMEAMQALITSIETTIAMDAYQERVFARNSNAAHGLQTHTKGAFMGYDFHISPDGPRLIEINSNAGGAFIVDALTRTANKQMPNAEAKISQMFLDEWRLAGRTRPLQTIAIVDENPKEQFHYPDMCLARDMLNRRGFTVVIASPEQLQFDGQVLRYKDTIIDLVYNRLTDFALEEPQNNVLRKALLKDAAVITPSPRHHALYADKRNLALFSDDKTLLDWDVPKPLRMTLSRIPKTVQVTPDNAQFLWDNRRQYFFKPNAGFGSRAAYKGAKLTKKTWQHILAGGYIAQIFIPPPMRAVTSGDEKKELKYDLRVYTYDGKPLLLAARVYQGQTTNLRTAGGGLAPVILMDNETMICAS